MTNKTNYFSRFSIVACTLISTSIITLPADANRSGDHPFIMDNDCGSNYYRCGTEKNFACCSVRQLCCLSSHGLDITHSCSPPGGHCP